MSEKNQWIAEIQKLLWIENKYAMRVWKTILSESVLLYVSFVYKEELRFTTDEILRNEHINIFSFSQAI